MEADFNSNRIITRLLARPGINIFDEFINEIEFFFNRPVWTVEQLKSRENKKLKGNLWENFCRDWLLASGRYIKVFRWDEFAGGTKQDNGIDLVAQTATGYVAIQAKYRSKGKRVDWRTLSTFIALAERTGPYEKYLIITNCPSVTRKMPRTAKDQSICRQTFRNTSREHWMRMAGIYCPKTLTSSTPSTPSLTLEELRTVRIAHFTK